MITKDSKVAVNVTGLADWQKKIVHSIMCSMLSADRFSWDYSYIKYIGMSSVVTYSCDGSKTFRKMGFIIMNYLDFMKEVNPYKGKKVQVKCSSDKEFKRAQEFAFDLGYTWGGGGNRIYNDGRYLGLNFLIPMYLSHSVKENSCKYDIVITFDEFMGLETGKEPYASFKAGMDPHKKDACIVCNVSSQLIYWDGEFCNGDLREAYKYNILSEEEFMKKYKKTLKFEEYEVRSENGYLHVGCEIINLCDIRGFMDICDLFIKYEKSIALDAPNAYTWLKEHAKELDL